MPKPPVTILEYLHYYLKFCEKEKRLLPNSVTNYQRFLSIFKIWLHQSKLESLIPQNFMIDHLRQYQNFLSNRPIATTTKNLYLIGLRGLFSYFIEKGITVSIFPQQIKLLKISEEKLRVLPSELLDNLLIKKLINSPDISTITGWRDKALLSVLISTGLKVSHLLALSRSDMISSSSGTQLHIKTNNIAYNVSLSPDVTQILQEYLRRRTDTELALFINFRNKKLHLSRRLSIRSMERIVAHYTKLIGMPVKITPEVLRNIQVVNIINQESHLKPKGISHTTQIISHYIPHTNLQNATSTEKILSWNKAEAKILNEATWLKQTLLTMPEGYQPNKHPLLHCHDCITRKIALLIVSGTIQVTYYKKDYISEDLWSGLTKSHKILQLHRHGKDWHKKMMDVISEYFKKYKILTEPILNHGRADLGILLDSKNVLYVEIGTVSLFKLWYNFWTMKNARFLIVPTENYAIEFRT